MFVSLRACARMRVRVYIKERVSFWLQRWFMKDLHKKEKDCVFDDADQKNTDAFSVGVCLSNDLRKEIDCIESSSKMQVAMTVCNMKENRKKNIKNSFMPVANIFWVKQVQVTQDCKKSVATTNI